MINKELVDILVCPKCKGKIEISNDNKYILCRSCDLAYTVTPHDTPIMLIDEAKKIEDVINKG